MPLPNSATPSLALSLSQLQSLAANSKISASSAILTLQAGPVTANWIFSFLDECITNIARIDQYKNVAGLSAYATTQIPGYAGTLTTDLTATRTAIVNCINWVVTNFPKDSTAVFLLSHTLNADGSRTPRSFTSAQTAGLVTLLQAFVATIS